MTTTESLTLYRGQAPSGIGDGPGSPPRDGEQYFLAEGGVGADPAILKLMRPWTGLDAAPQDHNRLKDRLEGWSCFSTSDYSIVVRLTSAGTYLGRTAYFAHGRAWPVAAVHGPGDPGALLGDATQFDRPWRPPENRPPPIPASAIDLARLRRPLVDHPETAARLLASLHAVIKDNGQLVIVAPDDSFTTGNPLTALICFARAALPSHLKPNCRVRVHTRMPGLFLGQCHATLLVIPESERRNLPGGRVTTLDADGHHLGGPELAEAARGFAEAVVRCAIDEPQGLLRFSQLCARAPLDPCSAAAGSVVATTYRLATSLETGTEVAAAVRAVESADAPVTADAWSRLVADRDLRALAAPVLWELLLDPQATPEVTAGLSERVAAALRASRQVATANQLRAWWLATPTSTRGTRLADLVAKFPAEADGEGVRLVEPADAAALSIQSPVRDLPTATRLAALLAAELANNLLHHRQEESVDLAQASSDEAVRAVLIEAVDLGVLDTTWLTTLVESGDRDSQRLVCEVIRTTFARPAWRSTVQRALEGMHAHRTPLPPDFLSWLVDALSDRDPVDSLALQLVAARLLEIHDPEAAAATAERIVGGIVATDSRRRRTLLRDALDSSSAHLLLPCVVADGRLRFSWMRGDLLSDNSGVLARLEPAALIDMLAGCMHRDQVPPAPLRAALDSAARARPREFAAGLARGGLWLAWRPESLLDAAGTRRLAIAWLADPGWLAGETSIPDHATWRAVMADIADLTAKEMASLTHTGGARWPWLPSHAASQARDLLDRAAGSQEALWSLAITLCLPLAAPTSDAAILHLLAAGFCSREQTRPYVNAAHGFLSDAGSGRPWASAPTGDQRRRLPDLPREAVESLSRLTLAIDLTRHLDWYLFAAHLTFADDPSPDRDLVTPALRSVAAQPEPEQTRLLHLAFASNWFRERLGQLLQRSPRAVMDLLTEVGAWAAWRATTNLAAPEIRRAALEWLRCQASRTVAPSIENWRQVVSDLAADGASDGGLAGDDLLQSDSAPEPRWPWIPGYDREQLQDLCQLAADLGAVIEIHRLRPNADPNDWSTMTAIVRATRFHDVEPSTLWWLRHPEASESSSAPPPPSLAVAKGIQLRAGHLKAAARALLKRARQRVIDALSHGMFDDPAWQELETMVAEHGHQALDPDSEQPVHPVVELACEIVTTATSYENRRRAWRQLESVLARATTLLHVSRSPRLDLPVFHLAAALLTEEGIGNIAVRLLAVASRHELERDHEWSQALVVAMRRPRPGERFRRAGDRLDVALALVQTVAGGASNANGPGAQIAREASEHGVP